MARFLLLLLLVISSSLFAQDLSLYNHFHVDKTFYNASYAGEYRNPVLHMTYRKQWSGLSGAPEIIMLAGNYAVPNHKNVAFAARIYQNKTGIFARHSIKCTGAYGVPVGKLSHLNFGLSLGLLRNSISWDRLSEETDERIDDPALYRVDRHFDIDGDFGMHYSLMNKRQNMLINVGFALPQMFHRRLKEASAKLKYLSHSVFSVSVEKYFGSRIFTDATILYRIGSTQRNQVDLSTRIGAFLGDHAVWLSYLHRTNNTNILGAGLTWQNIGLSFTYDVASQSSNRSFGNSYEIHLSYFFGKKRQTKIPIRLNVEIENVENEKDWWDEYEEDGQDEMSYEKNDESQDIDNQEEQKYSETVQKSKSSKIIDHEISEQTKNTLPEVTLNTPKIAPQKTYEEFAEALDHLGKGGLFILKNVAYQSKSHTLKSSSFVQLDQLAVYLKHHPNVKIEIGGHTDNTASDEKNLMLSQNRAKQVAIYIVKRGVRQEQIVSRGYGSSMPITGNDDDEDRQINQRTELRIVQK